MLSKPVSALLLVGGLFGALVGGGYVAFKTFGPRPEDKFLDDLAKIEQESPAANGSSASGGADAPGVGASRDARGGRGNPRGAPPPPRLAPLPGVTTGGAVGGTIAGGTGATVAGSRGAAAAVEEPPVPTEVEVPAGEILDIQLLSGLSSATAKVEDRVDTKITKDLRVGKLVAVPAGSLLIGSVTVADRGSKIKTAAQIAVRFHTLRVKGEPDVPVVIDPLIYAAQSPAPDSKLKIGGGAAAGAALGWLKGGVGGAIQGGAIGGGAGATAKMMEAPKVAELPAGAQARVMLRAPITVVAGR